jgi:hypothetical protein
MINRSIDELACEAADEFSPKLEGFEIVDFEELRDALKLTFAWKLPLNAKVILVLHHYDTDESVKSAIRRQLEAQGLRLTPDSSTGRG